MGHPRERICFETVLVVFSSSKVLTFLFEELFINYYFLFRDFCSFKVEVHPDQRFVFCKCTSRFCSGMLNRVGIFWWDAAVCFLDDNSYHRFSSFISLNAVFVNNVSWLPWLTGYKQVPSLLKVDWIFQTKRYEGLNLFNALSNCNFKINMDSIHRPQSTISIFKNPNFHLCTEYFSCFAQKYAYIFLVVFLYIVGGCVQISFYFLDEWILLLLYYLSFIRRICEDLFFFFL